MTEEEMEMEQEYLSGLENDKAQQLVDKYLDTEEKLHYDDIHIGELYSEKIIYKDGDTGYRSYKIVDKKITDKGYFVKLHRYDIDKYFTYLSAVSKTELSKFEWVKASIVRLVNCSNFEGKTLNVRDLNIGDVFFHSSCGRDFETFHTIMDKSNDQVLVNRWSVDSSWEGIYSPDFNNGPDMRWVTPKQIELTSDKYRADMSQK